MGPSRSTPAPGAPRRSRGTTRVAVLVLFGLAVAVAALLRRPPSGHSGASPEGGHEIDGGVRPQRRPPSGATAGAGREAGHTPADRAFNPGFVGAPCERDSECTYPGGFCLTSDDGFPGGTCSRACAHLCPDRHGDLYAPTFCVESPVAGHDAVCLAQCNLHLTDTGCRPGYVCTSLTRAGEETSRLVCLPDRGTPPPPTACTRRLRTLGVTFARPDIADADARGARPGDPRPRESTCLVDTPVLLATPLRGVDYRPRRRRVPEHVLVACPMALALERLSRLLADLDVVEVEHAGTFVCRGVAGTRTLSGHGRGLAIDVTGFERARGAPLSVEADWAGPSRERRRALRTIVRAIQRSGIFDVVLTPASNAAHHDHLHLEIKVGGGPPRDRPGPPSPPAPGVAPRKSTSPRTPGG